jgi:hypothetical protein
MLLPSAFRRAAPLVALSTLLMASCDANSRSLGPSAPAWQIAHGGEFNSDPSFVFLDPIVKNSVVPDAFNPNLSPNIRICEVANTEADPANWVCVVDASGDDVLLREFGPSAITVEYDRYIREWKLDDAEGPVEVGGIYRVTVRVGDYFLGYVDVGVGSNMSEARNLVSGDVIPVNENRTLVIAFHAGRIRCPTGADCFAGTVPASGGTVVTEDGFAVAEFPAGWYDESLYGEEVNVFITEKTYSLVDPCLPVQGGYLQFGSCYTYTTEPDVGDFLVPVIIGQCQDAAAQASNYAGILQLGAWDSGDPVRVLPNAATPTGLVCSGYAMNGAGFLKRLAGYASAALGPRPLWAAAGDLGLGGSIGAFSDVGWLVPLYGSVYAGNGQTGTVGTQLQSPASVMVMHEHSHFQNGTVSSSWNVEAGVLLTFTSYDVDGTSVLATTQVATDANGLASVPWTLGNTAGSYTLEVTGPLIEPVVFTATALPADAGTVSGSVMSAHQPGTPLTGAQVQVQSSQIGAVVDVNGLYSLQNVPVGPQVLVASSPNHTSQMRRADVVIGQVATVNFQMGLALANTALNSTQLTIEGAGTTYSTDIINDLQTSLQGVEIRAWVEQGMAQLQADAAFEVVCGGNADGDLPPGTCVPGASNFVVSNQAAGTGQLTAGPAVAVIELLLNGSVVDVRTFPITLQ